MNSKAGCAGSVLNLLKEPGFNHQAQLVTGILEEECSEMMSSFFTELRKKKLSSGNSLKIPRITNRDNIKVAMSASGWAHWIPKSPMV